MSGYEGQVVLNYRLTRKLGAGGFGAVYLAEQLELGRRAACKILHPQFAREAAVVDRFFREARAICEIGHRAIVTIENFGHLANGVPFYLMELVPGRSLSSTIAAQWLTSAQLVAIFDPIADALGAAHAKQIVHRDLKPDNIMVHVENDRVDEVRLLDFGIAKLMDRDGAGSITGTIMGTPAYMAPEQTVDAKHVDARADIYAFGATVYTAIARRPPFTSADVVAILLEQRTRIAPSLASLRPGVLGALESAVARCLAKDREQRPPTIAVAWAAIREALEQHALPVPGAAPARGSLDATVLPGDVAMPVAVTLAPTPVPVAVPMPVAAGPVEAHAATVPIAATLASDAQLPGALAPAGPMPIDAVTRASEARPPAVARKRVVKRKRAKPVAAKKRVERREAAPAKRAPRAKRPTAKKLRVRKHKAGSKPAVEAEPLASPSTDARAMSRRLRWITFAIAGAAALIGALLLMR